MDRKYTEIGYICHKYIMRNMNCKNEMDCAQFAKSYYALKHESMSDLDIVSELYALSEYAMLTSKSVRPNFMKRGDIQYQEATYFSSLQKDNSIITMDCEQLTSKALKNKAICSFCPRSIHYANAHLLEYEKLLRTLLSDIMYFVEFEQHCNIKNIAVSSFFIPVYDLGSIFTLKKPIIYPVLQNLYDLYSKRTSVFSLLSSSNYCNSLRDNLFLPVVEYMVDHDRLPAAILNIKDHVAILTDYFYELIMGKDTSIYTKEELPMVFDDLGKVTLTYLLRDGYEKKPVRTSSGEKNKRTHTAKKKRVEPPQQISLTDIFNDTTLQPEPSVDTLVSHPLPVKGSNNETFVTITLEDALEKYGADDLDYLDDDLDVVLGDKSNGDLGDNINLTVDDNLQTLPAAAHKAENSLSEIDTEGLSYSLGENTEIISVTKKEKKIGCCHADMQEVIPRLSIDGIPSICKIVTSFSSCFLKETLPLVTEVIYNTQDQKEYLFIGNLSNSASMLYVLSAEYVSTIPEQFYYSTYEKICFNPYSLLRFLSADAPVYPSNYYSLDSAYFFITNHRSDFKTELMQLSDSPYVTDIYNLLSLFVRAHTHVQCYLKEKLLEASYINYLYQQKAFEYSYLSYKIVLQGSGSNVVCTNDAFHSLRYSSIQTAAKTLECQFLLLNIEGIKTEKKEWEFTNQFSYRLVERNFFKRYNIAFMVCQSHKYAFIVPAENMPAFASYVETELLDIGRSMHCKLNIKQKISYCHMEKELSKTT